MSASRIQEAINLLSQLLFWDDATQRMAEENPEDEALALYAKDCSIKTYMAVHSFRHELPTLIISGDNRVTVPSLGFVSD